MKHSFQSETFSSPFTAYGKLSNLNQQPKITSRIQRNGKRIKENNSSLKKKKKTVYLRCSDKLEISPTSNINPVCGIESRASTQIKAASSLLRLPFAVQPWFWKAFKLIGHNWQPRKISTCQFHFHKNQNRKVFLLIICIRFTRIHKQVLVDMKTLIPHQIGNLVFHLEYSVTCQS